MALPAPAVWQRLLLLAALLGLGGLLWWIGAFDDFRDMDRVRTLLDAWGPWAYVLFVATIAVLQPLGIPAIFWILPAALIWPFPVAFPLSMTGAVCAASVGFFLARYLARDWVAARLPERIRRHDEKIAANGLRAVVLARLVFRMSPPLHWLFGLSRVSLHAYLLGTVLGILPSIFLITYFGESALRWLAGQSSLAVVVVGAVVVVVLVARRLIGGRSRADPARD